MRNGVFRGLDLPAGIWEPFASGRAAVRCSPGYLIYLQDTQATCFYYLKSGRVNSFIQSADGTERVLNRYEAGSLFGEASFFDELPRVSSAVALTPCEIVPIDRELVTQVFAREPELALAMMKYLARTVRLLSGHVDDISFRPADRRTAQYLLDQMDGQGQVRSTQEEIGAAIGASRVTVSRAISDFVRRGWVQSGYGLLQVQDPAALEKFASGT